MTLLERKDTLDGAKGVDDGFDIELEDALQERPTKRHAGISKDGRPRPSLPRAKRDAKFGFGGKVGRRAKQNTKESTDDGSGGGGGRGKGKLGSGKKASGIRKFGRSTGGSKRPGKTKRMAQRGK
jgi:rRNA-processing protein EBP2